MSDTLFATPLNVEDPYDLRFIVEPEHESRTALPGQLVALPVNTGYVGPFVVEECDEKFVTVYDPTWKPEIRWQYIRYDFIECEAFTEGWYKPSLVRPSRVLPNHYGEFWVFADAVELASDFEQQLHAVKRRYVGLFGRPLKEPRDESRIAKCSKCLSWPCIQNNGCPDWTLLAKGRFWNREAKRFETASEAMERHTIFNPVQIELLAEAA